MSKIKMGICVVSFINWAFLSVTYFLMYLIPDFSFPVIAMQVVAICFFIPAIFLRNVVRFGLEKLFGFKGLFIFRDSKHKPIKIWAYFAFLFVLFNLVVCLYIYRTDSNIIQLNHNNIPLIAFHCLFIIGHSFVGVGYLYGINIEKQAAEIDIQLP